MQLDQDTIVAVATPPGRGGIGIVRLSGAQARAIAAPLCRLRNPLLAGRARFAEILDDDGAVLDEAVVTYFAAPHSYTSEDVVEIAAHGAPVLLEYLVRACLRGGARLAEPGEFTARAFLSGRLDLTQAEAVNDLIAAQTLTQARMAAAQLGGSVAQKVAPMKQKLIRLIAELEAGVDFAEDDLDLMPQAAIVAQTMAILAEVENFAATYSHARIVREGVTLAIVGRPNAGKSSLFNRLLGLERAIVTAQPGTTRDAIAEQLAIGGIPVELIDTAGLRDAPEGEAEALGIARTRTALAEAYLVLYVIDATSLPARDAEDNAIEDTLAGCNHLVLYNKCDLVKTRTESQGLYLSTRTGEGIDALQQAMLAAMTRMAPTTDTALVTNLRQHQTLTEAVQALRRGQWGAAAGVPHEVLLLDLHAALEALDALTGATSSDDILRLIFSTFCIGK